MDLAAASAGPWLVFGAVLGVLLSGAAALAASAVRHSSRSSSIPGVVPAGDAAREPPGGWTEDDLPGFLDRPPGIAPEPAETPAAANVPLTLAEPMVVGTGASRRPPSGPAGAAPGGGAEPGRLLLVLATVAVLLVGMASALAAAGTRDPSNAWPTGGSVTPAGTPTPTPNLPALAAVPENPEPGDPGAGRLAAVSVPIGDDGALARLAFAGLVLERRAVGVTVAYPHVSLTAAAVPGPALAHVRLTLWNCLSDTAPDDPVAAGCRRLPDEYADLPTPALTVAEDREGLRIAGRFPTYVRPSGSPPHWTGRVYPFAVRVVPDGDDATGTLHLGTEAAASLDDPRLSDFRRGR